MALSSINGDMTFRLNAVCFGLEWKMGDFLFYF